MAAPELTIGEFARRTGLSAKGLRLYEDRGFLRPVRVDVASGYRYYQPEQVERGRTIALLRRLDLPLADIAEVLELPPDRIESRLRAWWAGRRRHLDDRRGALELVIRALAADGTPVVAQRLEPPKVEVVSLPARTVATIGRQVAQPDLVATFAADALEIRQYLTDSGLEHDDSYWVEYHDAVGPGLVGRIETCVPYQGAGVPSGEITLRAEPARRAATIALTTSDLSYPAIMAVYAALETWVEANATPTASVREMYTGTWCADGAEVGRLAQPIASG